MKLSNLLEFTGYCALCAAWLYCSHHCGSYDPGDDLEFDRRLQEIRRGR